MPNNNTIPEPKEGQGQTRRRIKTVVLELTDVEIDELTSWLDTAKVNNQNNDHWGSLEEGLYISVWQTLVAKLGAND